MRSGQLSPPRSTLDPKAPRPRLFGTDGIRAAFGQPPLDEATVRRLAVALARELHEHDDNPRVVLGGDTRDSTPVLCRWLTEELAARDVEHDLSGHRADALRRLLGPHACGHLRHRDIRKPQPTPGQRHQADRRQRLQMVTGSGAAARAAAGR